MQFGDIIDIGIRSVEVCQVWKLSIPFQKRRRCLKWSQRIYGVHPPIFDETHCDISTNPPESSFDFTSTKKSFVPKKGGNPPKWMVKIMENPYFLMDDLGVPLFLG